MKNLVILTGAGMSAESGINTFRYSGGLWENYDVMQVAVYPAAGLVNYVQPGIPVYLIDPNDVSTTRNVKVIKEKASVGMKLLQKEILTL